MFELYGDAKDAQAFPAGWAGVPGGRLILMLLLALVATGARAAIQFDVFLGYDGIISEASWFPVVCEVKNDGPSFTGVVEIAPSAGGLMQEQVRREVVELPTGTLKRLVIPVFSSARYRSSWDARLLDERGACGPSNRPWRRASRWRRGRWCWEPYPARPAVRR